MRMFANIANILFALAYLAAGGGLFLSGVASDAPAAIGVGMGLLLPPLVATMVGGMQRRGRRFSLLPSIVFYQPHAWVKLSPEAGLAELRVRGEFPGRLTSAWMCTHCSHRQFVLAGQAGEAYFVATQLPEGWGLKWSLGPTLVLAKEFPSEWRGPFEPSDA